MLDFVFLDILVLKYNFVDLVVNNFYLRDQ